MDTPPGFPQFPDPVARADRCTVSEQTPCAIWVLHNDSHAFRIYSVNGQPIGADHTVTLPSGSVVERVRGSPLELPYLIYEPSDAFDHLLTGTQAIDRFRYSVQSQGGGTDRAVVTITIVGASDTSGLVLEPPFRPLEYTASYDDLIAAFGVDQKAATRHFETTGYREKREISFNGLEYIASYSDLAGAFGTNRDAGSRHFITTGDHEGRSVTFDGLQYIASHPDLIDAFGVDRDAGAAHFIRNGAREGRLPDDFDAVQYLANYADLQAAFGSDQELATAHFIVAGYHEGRTDAPISNPGDFLF